MTWDLLSAFIGGMSAGVLLAHLIWWRIDNG